NGVERRDRVEGVVLVGQRLEIALAQVGLGQTLARHGQEPGRGVEPRDGGATPRGEHEREPGATAGIEQKRAALDLERIERGLEEGSLDGLCELGPVASGGAPEPALPLCAAHCLPPGSRYARPARIVTAFSTAR